MWTRNQVTNTDRYVATVSPLASDPAIQDAVADQITAQVLAYIDIQGLTTQAVEALASRGLSPEMATQLEAFAVPIANGVQSFTRNQVGKVVESDAFADAWVQANRVAHAELVAALTGEGGGAVTVENDTVRLNLAAFIETVKARLVESGFALAARIPEVNASFVLFQSADVTRARSAFNLLNTLGVWLPIITLVLLVLGVYVAKDHRRALVGAGVGVAVAMVVLALALAVFRAVYLDAVPATVLPHDAAAVLYDTIVRFLSPGVAHHPGPRAGGCRRGVPDRPVRHRGAHPPIPDPRHRLAAGQRRAGRVAHRPGRYLGACQQAGPAHRRRRPGSTGAGVLGPADRQGRHRPHPGPPGRPCDHRVPRATRRPRRRLRGGSPLKGGSAPTVDGSVPGIEVGGGLKQLAAAFAEFEGASSGLLADDDLQEAAAALEPGTSAAVIVLPGLLRAVARTAVVAGTATAVSNRSPRASTLPRPGF